MDDTEYLLANEQDNTRQVPVNSPKELDTASAFPGETGGEDDVRVKAPTRCCVVEPIVLLVGLTWYPLDLSVKLFTYDKFQHIVAKETNFNLTLLDNDSASRDTCGSNTSSDIYQFTEEVQKRNAYYNMVANLIYAVPCLITTIQISAYSDKAGRRFAMIYPSVMLLVYLSVAFAMITFDLPLWVYFIAKLCDGLGGGYTVQFVGIYAYVADTTSLKQRHFRITLIYQLVNFLTIVVPPFCGFWIKYSGYVWPSLLTVAGQFIIVIYTIFAVPETLIKTENTKLWSLTHIKDVVTLFVSKSVHRRRWQLCVLYASTLFAFIAYNESTVEQLFQMNIPLCWGSVTISIFNSVSYGASALLGIAAVKVLGRCVSDEWIALVSGLIAVAHFLYQAFVRNTLMMFLTCLFSVFSYLFIPSLRSLMSKLVDTTEQGTLFGAIGLCQTSTTLISGLMFNAIYANTLWISPGFVFIVVALFYAIAVVLMGIYMVGMRSIGEKYVRGEEAGTC